MENSFLGSPKRSTVLDDRRPTPSFISTVTRTLPRPPSSPKPLDALEDFVVLLMRATRQCHRDVACSDLPIIMGER